MFMKLLRNMLLTSIHYSAPSGLIISFFLSLLLSRCKFFSLTETPEDYTIIVDEDGFKGRSCGYSFT